MDKYQVLFNLAGQDINPPKNWMDIAIRAVFGDFVQPQIEIDEFTFVNENAQIIFDWIDAGRIFEGIPFIIQINSNELVNAQGQTGAVLTYSCILDPTEMVIISPVEVRIKIKPDESVQLFEDRAKAITYQYLADLDRGERGFIDREHYVDVPVVIRKKFDATETALVSLSILIISREIAEIKDKLSKSTIDKLAAALSDPLQKPAEFFRALAMALLILAYTAFILIAIINMLKSLVSNLIPKPTRYKGMYLRTALERALDYFDMELDCDIPEIDYIVYLPSKTDDKIRRNRKDEGVPNTADYGYNVAEMFELIYKLFRAEPIVAQTGNGKKKLIIVAEKSPRLRNASGYIMPNDTFGGQDILRERYRYNADELKSNFLISFQYDPSDEYTMPNARDTAWDSKKKDEEKDRYEKGVAYEVITDINDPLFIQNKLNKGLEEVRIPMALGSRRNNLSVLERTAQYMLSVVDLVIKLFGGKTFNEKIDEGRGRLLISHNSFNTAKLVVLQNGLIPQNHRDILSARALYDNYHYWRSFKTNPQYAQKLIYEDYTIPFGFSDFIRMQTSSRFSVGLYEGKFRELKWTIAKDTAQATFEIYRQYCVPDKLYETKIEP